MERTNVRNAPTRSVKVKREVHKNSFSLYKPMRVPECVKEKVLHLPVEKKKVSCVIDL